MIIAFIFIAHCIFVVLIFRKKLKSESITSAFLNIALIIILFAIGWSLTSMFAKWIMKPEGFGKFFDRNTFSLTILTIVEFFFYRFYYKPDFKSKKNNI